MKIYAHPEVEYKFIGEHEYDRHSFNSKTLIYSLGLGDNAYGIKIKTLPKINLAAACEIFALHDSQFHQELLSAADCKDSNDYCQNNMLIPAYFKDYSIAWRFIALLANNVKLSATTDLHINLSGEASPYLYELFTWCKQAKDLSTTNLKQIVMRTKGKPQQSVPLNPEGTRSVTIFADFNLSDASYLAINQQAAIAGVSGDNSFELAAGLALPYYHSSNFQHKRPTLQTVEKICDELPTLPEKIKADFKTFFGSLEVWNEELAIGDKYPVDVAQQFKVLDLPGMFEHWHVFAEYLQQHYNFYDKLEDVILNNNVMNNQEYFASSKELEQSSPKIAKLKNM